MKIRRLVFGGIVVLTVPLALPAAPAEPQKAVGDQTAQALADKIDQWIGTGWSARKV
jgi:hypothetical protein